MGKHLLTWLSIHNYIPCKLPAIIPHATANPAKLLSNTSLISFS